MLQRSVSMFIILSYKHDIFPRQLENNGYEPVCCGDHAK